jgi:hypothetical protein
VVRVSGGAGYVISINRTYTEINYNNMADAELHFYDFDRGRNG